MLERQFVSVATFRSDGVESVPPASNFINLLNVDTTFFIDCGSYFNVARFEKKKCHYTSVEMRNKFRVFDVC